MGTWGVKTFDNDSTSDWLLDLEKTDDASLLEEALDIESTEYLEAPAGELALAAAEIVNGIANSPRGTLPAEAIAWIDRHKNLDVSSLVPKAITLIDRVLSDASELKELWIENEEDFPAWETDVKDLQTKLKDS